MILAVPRESFSTLKAVTSPDSVEQTNPQVFPSLSLYYIAAVLVCKLPLFLLILFPTTEIFIVEKIFIPLPPLPRSQVHTCNCRFKCRLRYKLSEWGKRNSTARAGKELRIT